MYVVVLETALASLRYLNVKNLVESKSTSGRCGSDLSVQSKDATVN